MDAERELQSGSNWKVTIAYDGTDFYGWQVQPDRATIQGRLAEAIERVTGERVLPQGSGRTDAGVHARGQVASFFLNAAIPAGNLLRALNRKLPEAIRVLSAEPAAAEFHARHSARAKTYEYRIFRGEICAPWTARFAWALSWPLELERMRVAAALVVGTHDFTSFAASDPDFHPVKRNAYLPGTPDLAMRRGAEGGEDAGGAGNVRTVFESGWGEDGELLGGLLTYRVRGDGFLHHMVRNLVGTFVDVGRGQMEPAEVARILGAKCRSEAGATAPARGLFLDCVEY
jgi:tRNA pseudouridine38-40 synthase